MGFAIVLSGQTAGLGVIRALGHVGIHSVVGFHDPTDIGRKSIYVLEEKKLPHPEKQEAEFVQCLMEYSSGLDGAVLFPTSDATLSVVSRNKSKLAQKFRVACPEWAITKQFLDKKNTSVLVEKYNLPAPKTLLPKCTEDIEAWESHLKFPCLVKPSQVHLYNQYFHRKMTWVDDMDHLLKAFREAQERRIDVMIQEYIPGADRLGANYNAYYWEGKPLCEFTAHKIRNAPPTMGSPCVLVSEVIPEVMEIGRKLLGAVGFSGYACSEFKLDPRDGVYKLMEVNVRHNLSSLLAVKCGMNFPWINYTHLVNGEPPEPHPFQTGIYWIDVTRDLGYRMINLGRERISVGQMVSPYFKKHVFAVLDWQDPKPALLRVKNLSIDAFRRIFRWVGHQVSRNKFHI